MLEWSTSSWKLKPRLQDPFQLKKTCKEDDAAAVQHAQHHHQHHSSLEAVESRLEKLPPLVQPEEVDRLKAMLREVADGKRFLLQGGDCAETFDDCNADLIQVKLKILLQMSLVISWMGKVPTLRIGRMAGQYAKPRSSMYELVNGEEVVNYFGDSVNSSDAKKREPDPQRLLEGYYHSASTLNCVRALLSSGFADLHESKHWDVGFYIDEAQEHELGDLVDRLLSALDFMKTCGIPQPHQSQTIDFFTSHEALTLNYEAAMTRKSKDKWYDTSAHFLWIGDRTRQIDHAHVEFCRGIQNPIGIKVGPSSVPEELIEICKLLNPQNEVGKIVLITRFGAKNVRTMLPSLITAVKHAAIPIIFQCDPMHGNTTSTTSEERIFKTRKFDSILLELFETWAVHQECGSLLGGVHFELTGEDVTECTGGPQELTDADLPLRYCTECDPRLNYAQSIEMSLHLSKLLAGRHNSRKRCADKAEEAENCENRPMKIAKIV